MRVVQLQGTRYVCQSRRGFSRAWMVVLGNLFSCDVDGGSNQATADTLPLFRRATTLTVQLDADIRTNVDIAILTPGYTFTGLGRAIRLQPLHTRPQRQDGDRSVSKWSPRANWFRQSKQHQRQTHVIRRSRSAALTEMEPGRKQFHGLQPRRDSRRRL